MSKRERYKKLVETVDTILELAKIKRGEIGGAVNWEDLRCDSVHEVYDRNGEYAGLVVYISEAAESAVQLQLFVQSRLQGLGWHDISVATEW